MQETSQKQRGGTRQGTRWCSRSTQQILDVSVPFISEQRLERITWEAEPLILKMTAEAVQSPVAQIVEHGRRRTWCHCWNASRTGHLNRSLIDACESMTIVRSCTDQCHTASLLSWRSGKVCSARLGEEILTECAFITCWTSFGHRSCEWNAGSGFRVYLSSPVGAAKEKQPSGQWCLDVRVGLTKCNVTRIIAQSPRSTST